VVFSIVFGILGMYINIKNSLITPEVEIEDKASVIEGLNRIKDTDGDGLPDYDELNLYNTSPYLEDTDLDGVSDYDEVILGLDGKCIGANCEMTVEIPKSESEFMAFLKGLDFENLDFNEFKNILLATGYEKESVDLLTEQEFNQMKQMLAPASSLNSESSQEQKLTDGELKQIENLKNLSIQEIKDLMIQGGATNEQLSQFSDDELKQLYLQTLDEMSSSQ
jgi:hypothetical protein